MKVLGLVGTRPNLIKMAPVINTLREYTNDIESLFIHTGQHFDQLMSQIFFEDLELPVPDINLNVGNLTPWNQTAQIIEKLGDIINQEKPDLVIVPGDVNSSLAGAIATIRAECPLAHLESGLRSFDRTMPEELNRIAIDHLSDLLFVTEPSGLNNLKNEGISENRFRFVGNTMIDTLLKMRDLAYLKPIRDTLNLEENEPYILMTMHRPSNVDNIDGLKQLYEIISYATTRCKVIFPIHPRTRKRLKEYKLNNLFGDLQNLILTEPLGYLDFIALLNLAIVVMTDSGGIQEETTVLGVPCLTLRNNTERPITCELGTNRLAGTAASSVNKALDEVLDNPPKGFIPEYWDGNAAQRVVQCILNEKKMS